MAVNFSCRVYLKLLRVLSRMGIAQRIALSLPVWINARRFRIPIILSVGEGNIAMSDSWAMEIFSTLLPVCEGAVLDVGANVGQTLLKVKSAAADRMWIGFEPNTTCVMYLERLIEANRFERCTLIPGGVYARTQLMGLDHFHDDPADKTASLIKGFRPGEKVLKRKWVPVFEFSALARAGINEPIGIVKIDVEGGEKEVLETLREILRRDRPFVLLEILPVYTAKNGERLLRQQTVEKQFRELNYTVCRAEKDPDDRLTGLRPMAEIGVHDQIVWSDYLVIPTERLQVTFAKFGFALASPSSTARTESALTRSSRGEGGAQHRQDT